MPSRRGAPSSRWAVLPVFLWAAACAPSPGQGSSRAGAPAPFDAIPKSPAETHEPPAQSEPARAPSIPLLLLTEPELVRALERRGLALGERLGSPGTGSVDNERLHALPRYASVVDVLTRDVSRAGHGDPLAGVGVHRYAHRLFDTRWLTSPHARFELVAVVNRLDRAPFLPGSCGETRLVYRLSYTTVVGTAHVASRMPMTLGLELFVPKDEDGCRAARDRWSAPAALETSALADWLTRPEGPLAPDRLERARRQHRLVVNLQQVRWPSTVRPSLGGHAEYLLRSFEPTPAADRYAPAGLENTPDVSRANDPEFRRELVAWLLSAGTLDAIERGTVLLPEQLRADHAISVTPRGLGRRANRPFRSLLDPGELAALTFRDDARLATPEALLRRLDQLSCPGCHQARSNAGFHLLGDDATATPSENALASGLSPHLVDDLERRAAWLGAAADGSRDPIALPFAERGVHSGYGAHCSLGEDPSFRSWVCAEGLTCQRYDAPDGDAIGQCLPAGAGTSGDPCEVGRMTIHADPKRDGTRDVQRSPCAGNGACNANAVGFPGGMCSEGCAALSKDAACGSLALLDPFNACVARGDPFLECLQNNVRPAGFRACSAAQPCRDDYLCARAPNGGVCIPPYFLFQLRVDGHP